MRAHAETSGGRSAAASPPPAFRIGAAHDPAEADADRVAARVLGDGVLRRKCDACEREETLSRRADGGSVSPGAPRAVRAALAEGGAPLAAPDAAFFGSAMSADLSGVRVHTGAAADRAARSVGARAFALGQHLVFAEGAYRPSSASGRALLAHELAHVAADRRGPTLRRQAAPPQPRNRAFRAHGVNVLIRSDCETTPGFSFALMRTAVTEALDAIFTTNCIAARPRAAMQRNLTRHGLDFHCADSADLENAGACAEATGFSIPANIFTIGTEALTSPGCGQLRAVVLHEIVHVVRGTFGEDLPMSCEASCFGIHGDPTLCREGRRP
jgi:hypothetical protein